MKSSRPGRIPLVSENCSPTGTHPPPHAQFRTSPLAPSLAFARTIPHFLQIKPHPPRTRRIGPVIYRSGLGQYLDPVSAVADIRGNKAFETRLYTVNVRSSFRRA